jgi:hypothetical protein
VWGTLSERVFQTWIGVNGVEDITFNYPPGNLPADPGQALVIGAENENGSGGEALPPGVLPTEDLAVVSSDPIPGGSVSYTVDVRGDRRGSAVVKSYARSTGVLGTTITKSVIRVVR